MAYVLVCTMPPADPGGRKRTLRDINEWVEYWQQKLLDKVSISDIEAEGALSELDRITKLGMQKTRSSGQVKNEFVDSFYLKRIL
jgi:hypothetical protein